ncbi:MAG: SPOR domain-containing protein [Candidatus Omnitrophota bacterium]|nr:SPOR domain-containing protein [Candidatus Omnitrophota bacterium]
MEKENYQKELFEFEAPKRAAARFGNIFQKTDFVITLTPEKMVFAAIGVIMLMVVFFALGVEKGKAIVYAGPRVPKAISGEVIAFTAIPERRAAVSVTMPKSVVAAANIAPKMSLPAAPKKTQTALDRNKPYTIVAAAFSREDFALKEAGKLRANGLEAFAYYGEPYYLTCVGSFQDKRSAQKVLNKVRQMHRDAYVRVR